MNKTTRQEIVELARSHAEGAVDQQAAYNDGYTSFEAYHQNMYDTLVERGWANDTAIVELADREYTKRLRGLRVKKSATVYV